MIKVTRLEQPGASAKRRPQQQAISRPSKPIDQLPVFRFERIALDYRVDLGVALRGFGLDAAVLGVDSFESEATPSSWLGLLRGPIRWIEMDCWDWDDGPDKWAAVWMNYYVPDPRIASGLRKVNVVRVRVKTFPVWGQVKAVKWKVEGSYLSPRDKGFSLRVVDYLNYDAGLTNAMISAGDTSWSPDFIHEDVEFSCWIISGQYRGSHPEWTKQVWDCYPAIAEALLRMPMPTGE